MPRKASGKGRRRASAKSKGKKDSSSSTVTVVTERRTLLRPENAEKDSTFSPWIRWLDTLMRTVPPGDLPEIIELLRKAKVEYTQTVYTGPYGGDHSEKEEPKEEPMATGHGVATVKDEVKEEGMPKRKRGRPRKSVAKPKEGPPILAPSGGSEGEAAPKKARVARLDDSPTSSIEYDTLGPLEVVARPPQPSLDKTLNGVPENANGPVARTERSQPPPPPRMTHPGSIAKAAPSANMPKAASMPPLPRLPPGPLAAHAASPALAYAFLLHQAALKQYQQVVRTTPPIVPRPAKVPPPEAPARGSRGEGSQEQQNALLVQQLKSLVAANQVWGSSSQGQPGGGKAASCSTVVGQCHGKFSGHADGRISAVAGNRTQGLLAPKVDRLSGNPVSAAAVKKLDRAPVSLIPSASGDSREQCEKDGKKGSREDEAADGHG